MNRRALPTGVLLCLLGAVEPVAAQVTARQGTAAPPPQRVDFASPMILEAPLPSSMLWKPGTTFEVTGLQKYVCDYDVTIAGLTASRRPQKRRSTTAEFWISGVVDVADSHDRMVDIAIRMRVDDRIVGAGSTAELNAEEERRTPFRVRISVDDSQLAQAPESRLALELTLTVRDPD